jgi:AraC-like DNA-binding protein
MLSLCTSRCRETNGVVRHRRRQQSHNWRGCLPARQGSALSTGGIIADALVRLARGQDVASVSRGIGYASASAFAAMFRKALGKAPRDYFTHRSRV